MNALDDWARVKDVLERALLRDAGDLQTWLAEACGGDAVLRTRVETLLAARDQVGSFLETPAAVVLAPPAERADLTGRVVGSYQLLSRLGAGGMGEVFLAHDTKLDRPVALKFLAPEFAADQDRLRRFHQEARAASSLNHPHIVVVHDFGALDGRPYLVTEFVEGETLRRRLEAGALSVTHALEIGVQVAGALAAAHARGLVHRDVKPDNVMLRPDGYVKVLDFGLAKLMPTWGGGAGGDTASHTQPGTIMGTARYMSPEQARGIDLDSRSDVWSLGVMLFEMITGLSPFDGATAADSIAAVLSTKPPTLHAYAPHAPVALSAVVARALQKDARDRYGDAGELLADLRRLRQAASATSTAVATAHDDGDDERALSPAGERRRATVLVSVVAGYASLLDRLAPQDVEDVVARLRAAAVDTMRRHGGVVNQSIGEEIVSLFGIPTAHEDDDARAVRAALELHARCRDIGRVSADGPELRLSSGVHAGSVVARRLREGPRRYAITGLPAQTAARLAAAADADAVWVSADCQRFIAPFMRTEPRPSLPVGGDQPMVTPYCVLGESGPGDRLDAPGRSALTPYAGRTEELDALLARVEVARRKGHVAVIAGEAGAGKSRLLHELRATLAACDARILQGRCRSHGGVTLYLPFLEALQDALELKENSGRPDVGHVVARIRAIDASLEPFVPLYLHLLSIASDVFPVPRHLKGEHLQAAMLEAIAAFFTSYAQGCSPGLLLLEDWHWADDASRAALQHLAHVVAAYPLLVVVTTRPEPGLVIETADEPWRLALGPLEFAASVAIVKAVLGVDGVPEDFAVRLHERTSGNPFFLEEVCHGLSEAGLVVTQGSKAMVGNTEALHLPDSVQAVIRSRLDRLAADGREVVRVASVIGREFGRRVLAEVSGAADLTSVLGQLKGAGIVQQVRVVPDPVYRFKHALTQEVAYDSLLEHQRKALHLAVGRAIERCQPDLLEEPLALLVYHFSRAEAWDEAVGYALRAAARATELSQFSDALAMLENVQSWLLRLPDDPARRARLADVLFRQERLCETLGMRGRQLQLGGDLIALLAPHGPSERLAEAYLRLGDVSVLLKRFDAADRALATALRMSREHGHAAMERSALRSIGLLRWHQGRHDEALTITENALAIDRERADDLAVAGDLSNLGNVLRSLGRHERALAVLEEALAMPVVDTDPIKRAYLLHNIASVHRDLNDIGRALDRLQQANASARTHMLPIQRSFHLTSIAHIYLQDGRVEESLALYHEAVDLSRRARHADGLAQSLRMLSEVLVGLGRDGEALPHLEEAAQLFGQLEDRDAESAMCRHVAAVMERLAHPGAIAAWERVRALAQAATDARTELAALEGIARATRSLGSPDAAIRRCEDALALASRLGLAPREAMLRNTLGILHWERGAYAEALAQYEAALDLVRVSGDRSHEGLALNSIGVTLISLHRYEEARTALEEALIVNRRSGDKQLEGHSLAALGDLALATRRLESAERCFEASLAVRRQTEDRRGEGWMLHRLARTRAAMEDTAGAAALRARAAHVAESCGDQALARACRQQD